MLKRLTTFFVLAFFSVAAMAIQSPVDMLKITSNQLIHALKANRTQIKQNPEVVYELTEKILLPHVDVAAMSRLALGRQHWTTATKAQRKQFMQEFTSLMLRTYGAALTSYTDEEIKFKPLRINHEKQKRVQVNSLIIQRGGPSIPVSYRVYQRDSQWKVYDMTVDGVSMVQSFHSQFTDEVAKSGMDGLLKAMHRHAQQASNKSKRS